VLEGSNGTFLHFLTHCSPDSSRLGVLLFSFSTALLKSRQREICLSKSALFRHFCLAVGSPSSPSNTARTTRSRDRTSWKRISTEPWNSRIRPDHADQRTQVALIPPPAPSTNSLMRECPSQANSWMTGSRRTCRNRSKNWWSWSNP